MPSVSVTARDPHYGSFIGTLSNKEQGISGQLYSIDKSTVYLRNFTFTGIGSGKYFFIILKYLGTFITTIRKRTCSSFSQVVKTG